VNPDTPRWGDGKPPAGRLRLRLYVAGNSRRSRTALRNLLSICQEHLPGRFDLEVVDLYEHAHRASEAQILGAPTLVKEYPLPVRRLLGDLSDEQRVLDALMVRAG
jgi:circadian clock protein KaiB